MAGTAFSTSNWTGYDEQSASNPSSALIDFTLIVDISTLSADWKSNVQSDGGDIRVTKGDDTELAIDVIDWAYNAGSPTGLIRLKWSGTLASVGTQNVRVWSGYTGGTAVAYDATETYGSDNVYDSNWKGYWPLHDANDRTGNGHHLTPMGGITVGGVTGQIGVATAFDGVNDLLEYTTDAIVTGVPVTMAAWVKGNSPSKFLVSSEQSSPSNGGLALTTVSSGATRVGGRSRDTGGYSEVSTSGGMATGWNHAAAVFGSSTSRFAWLDGTKSTETTASNTPSITGTNDEFMIGARAVFGGTQEWDGDMQHVHIHDVARPDAWIEHEYAQTNDQATFWGTWAWTAVGGGVNTTLFLAARKRRQQLLLDI